METYAKPHVRYAEQSAGKRAAILTILTAAFAFFGWVGETLLFFYLYKEYRDRGLLTLPFCPLYGFGALAVYAVLRTPQSGIWAKLYRKPHSRIGKFFAVCLSLMLYALAAALLASLIEYFTGFFFDKKFGVRLWSYRRYPDNINGYVSIRYSLLWGLLCVSSMGLLWHPAAELLARANTAVVVSVAVVLFLAISADFLFNMFYLSNHGSRLTLHVLQSVPRFPTRL